MEIVFDKKVFIDSFYPLLFDQAGYEILRGGGGGGKSVFAVQKIAYRLLTEHNNRFLFVRAVKDTIRKSMYQQFKDFVFSQKLNEAFDFRETDMQVLCPSTNSEVICLGMNDRERIKSIAEPTSAWIEEATELEERDFRQLDIRIRSTKGGYQQVILTFNPIDENHWIRKEFFPPAIDILLDEKYDKRLKKRGRKLDWVDWSLEDVATSMIRKVKYDNMVVPITYTQHLSTYEENPFVDWKYKARLEDLRNKDFSYWQIYAKGKWGSIGNLVFNPSWQIKNLPESFDDVIYGMDFGYNHPSTLVECRLKDNVWYLKELVYVKKMSNSEFIEHVIKEVGLPDGSLIYADAAEPARIKEWQDNSPYDVRPSITRRESVKDGIDFIKSLEIYTHTDNHNLNRELKSYKWKEKDGKPIDEPLPINDDCIKAVIYAVYSYSKHNNILIGFID